MAKQNFKITNCPTYSKALRQRGSLAVWLEALNRMTLLGMPDSVRIA